MTSPNIVIFHCDQLRYDALGCTGHPGNPTPNIDQIAASGIAFQRHFTSNPVCMPSRASFMTGVPVTAHGTWTNGIPLQRREYLPFAPFMGNPDFDHRNFLPTLADIFSENGYATAAFGKLHLTPSIDVPGYDFPESDARWESGRNREWHGPYYGFEHVDLTHAHGECPGGHYAYWLEDEHPEMFQTVQHNGKTAPRPIPTLGDLFPSVLTSQTHPSTWIARKGINWISEQESPFLAFFGFPDPHHAFCPLPEDLEYFDGVPMPKPEDPSGEKRSEMKNCGQDVSGLSAEEHDQVRRYTAAMVRRIDLSIGEVIEQLKATGQWDNTLILFTSDHGDYLGDHGRLKKSHRAARTLLHVPCIIKRASSGEHRAVREKEATSNIDILPTLLAEAGLATPNHCQGSSLFADDNFKPHAIAHGFSGNPEEANFTLLDQKYRYTVYPHSGRTELFDHSEDPGESHNLAGNPQYEQEIKRLHTTLAEEQLNAVNLSAGKLSSW